MPSPSLPPATLVAVATSLAALPIALFYATHVAVAVAIAVAGTVAALTLFFTLVADDCPPPSSSRVSLNIAVFVVVGVRVRRQSGAFPAVAVAAGALVRARHQRPPPTVAFAARASQQGVAPRRERVRMDDEQCPRNTVGVGPESQLCEPVVTRLTQN